MLVYTGLFASAFVAATLLPMQSEAVLAALILQGERSVALLLGVATLGNVLGAVVNWGIGRFLLRFRHKRWFPTNAAQLARAQGWYQRYGLWSLLASWVPIIGDPITVVAGVLRTPLPVFVILVTLAKGLRYLFVAMAALAWV